MYARLRYAGTPKSLRNRCRALYAIEKNVVETRTQRYTATCYMVAAHAVAQYPL